PRPLAQAQGGPLAVLVGGEGGRTVGGGIDPVGALAQGDLGAFDGLAALVLDGSLEPAAAGPGLAPTRDNRGHREGRQKKHRFDSARKHGFASLELQNANRVQGRVYSGRRAKKTAGGRPPAAVKQTK